MSLLPFIVIAIGGSHPTAIPDSLLVKRDTEGITVRVITGKNTNCLPQEEFAWIIGQRKLDLLDLRNSNISPCQLVEICRRVELRRLLLSHTKLDQSVLKAICSQTGLVKLWISGTGIHASNLTPLQHCAKLQNLFIGDETRDASIDTASISQLKSLRQLTIVAKGISREEIKKLCSLRQLSFLTLYLVDASKGICELLQKELPRTDVSVRPKTAPPFGWGEE